MASRAASSFLVSGPVLPPRRQPRSACVCTCACVCVGPCVWADVCTGACVSHRQPAVLSTCSCPWLPPGPQLVPRTPPAPEPSFRGLPYCGRRAVCPSVTLVGACVRSGCGLCVHMCGPLCATCPCVGPWLQPLHVAIRGRKWGLRECGTGEAVSSGCGPRGRHSGPRPRLCDCWGVIPILPWGWGLNVMTLAVTSRVQPGARKH